MQKLYVRVKRQNVTNNFLLKIQYAKNIQTAILELSWHRLRFANEIDIKKDIEFFFENLSKQCSWEQTIVD